MYYLIGDRSPAHWQRTNRLIEAVRPKKRHRVRAPLDAARFDVNATARAVEGNLGGFCVWLGMRTKPARRWVVGQFEYGRLTDWKTCQPRAYLADGSNSAARAK
jgi:hypothetical protein